MNSRMHVNTLPVFTWLHIIVCCGWVIVQGSNYVELPDNFIDAILYQQEAVKTCLSDLYRMLHAESHQVYMIREKGNKRA